MGNWRRVHIYGTCDAAEVPALDERLSYSIDDSESLHRFCCLSYSRDMPGLAGLGAWPAERINRTGNLAERDYTPDDVATTLKELLELAPSLRVQVDCGGDYEVDECIATVLVTDDGVELVEPRVPTIPDIPDEQIESNLFKNLLRPR